MRLASESLALKAVLDIAPQSSAFAFRLRLQDATGKDRGLLVRLAVPVDAIGWSWCDDLQNRRTIETDKLYENTRPLRAFAALPEWKDKPDLRMGYNTLNFCTTIAGPAALCLAVPLDKPRIYRTAYHARHKMLTITYDVALCPDTRTPSEALFEFELYSADPKWGMRSALDTYYQRHPNFFANNTPRQGMWIAFTHLNTIDNVNEFGVVFQEGAGSAPYDDKLGVTSLTYYTHAGMYADVPDHRRGVDPTPALDRRIAAVEANFRRATGKDGAYAECGLHTPDGNLSAEPGAVYGDVLAQFCLEPEMFYGNWLLDRVDKFFADFRKGGGELDGFYYDGLTTGINYRREHFTHAEYPPSWDPIAKKPYLFNYFSSVEWARLVAEKLHRMGKVTMMNGAMGESPFCAPYLDIMGAETGLRIPQREYTYVRTICRHKPFVTLLKGNYAKLTSDQIELFMKRCLAYGVFPGYFDWPPSGLGPGGTYWDHAEYYERDRPLFRKYQPLVKDIAEAGWEPLTLASADNPLLQIERFGSLQKGSLYLTVLNDSADTIRSVLQISLPQTPYLVVFDEIARKRLSYEAQADTIAVPLDMAPLSVALLHICKPLRFMAHHLEACEKSFADADIQKKADEGRPVRPVYWHVTEERIFRDQGALLLRNDNETEAASASQWVMLFQDQARPITIKARVKTQGVSGTKSDTFALHAVVCYVDRQFTTRDPRTFQLDPGTSDWRNVEWTLTPERPVRSIQLFLRMNKRSGSAWFDDVSVRTHDDPEKDHVVDGAFSEWYEQLGPEQAAALNPAIAAVREVIRTARVSAAGESADLSNQLSDSLRSIQAGLGIIAARALDNPARRERRDLEAAWEHVSLCCQILTGIEGISLYAPDTSVQGDDFEVTARLGDPQDAAREAAFSLTASSAAKVERTGGRGKEASFRITVPDNIAVGASLALHGEGMAKLPSGVVLPLRASREVRIVEPFETSMVLAGISSSDASQQIALRLTNRLSRPSLFKLAATPPDGWSLTDVKAEVSVPPRSTETVAVTLAPKPDKKPGRYSFVAAVQAPGRPAQTLKLELMHVPPSANRLVNPGFEAGSPDALPGWSSWENGFSLDASERHTGARSLRLESADPSIAVGAGQAAPLKQTLATPLIVRGWSKAHKVNAPSERSYCLYVDIYYTDGTKLYGQTVPFEPGTHDWQFGQTSIETTKPVAAVSVYAMLRGATGTVWFDDLLLAEDTSRAGNVARHAKVQCDSFFRDYHAGPINDGVVNTADLHWTDAAWASDETETPHWVELRWDQPVTVREVAIFWSLDADIPRTSRRVEIQTPDANGWKTVQTLAAQKAEPESRVSFPPNTTTAIRVFQAKGDGIEGRPNLMWIREVEVR